MLGLEWSDVLEEALKLLVAFVLPLPIAWDRERFTRLAGLRTFPLVALASCGYVLVARSVIQDNDDAVSRVIQGLITGIGFIGGGAILKHESGVSGTATAASIWSTGAIGAAVAFGRYEIGVAIVALNFLVFRLLTPLKKSVSDEQDESVEDGEP